MRRMCPIFGVATLTLGVWELYTSVLAWMPLPYFPGPEGVLVSSWSLHDHTLLFDSTWHSLVLLLSGYAIGDHHCTHHRGYHWLVPTCALLGNAGLKVIGPIPATAWIPLAMVVAPSAPFSAVGLIALAVWFPVTMLTASGISNTRASYLDVARTLGAGRVLSHLPRRYPGGAAEHFHRPLHGAGHSFLTLVVAETVGVKSGLGWYVTWAQGWAEYGKVYGALVIMAAFFSTIMTVLFKVRDRVLVWQKGVIKW